MIVIKKDGIFYFCESKDGFISHMSDKDFTCSKENWRIMNVGTSAGRLIMADAPLRVADLIRYMDLFPRKLEPATLQQEIYPVLRKRLEKYSLMDDGVSPYDVFFARKDLCYVLRSYGVVEEVEEFFPCCRDVSSAIGLYLQNKDKPIEELIRSIYEGIETMSDVKQFPVVVLNTRTKAAKIITREGASQ